MSFLYPFTVTITRPSGTLTQTADGAVQGTTSVIATTPAAIQLKRDKGASSPVAFPAATNTSAPLPYWMIYLQMVSGLAALGPNGIRDGDSVLDDGSGRQWKVDAAEYTPLGWRLACSVYKPDA